jgi:hypothetical protein
MASSDHIPEIEREGAMNAIAVPKSSRHTQLEGAMLTAVFQGFPVFAETTLLLKIAGSHEVFVQTGAGAGIFVMLTSIMFALIMTWLGPKYPRFFKTYEPLFYDTTLSFSEKLTRWRTQPTVSLQLVTTVMLMSLLAVAVVSLG